MKKADVFRAFLLSLLTAFTLPSFAWTHSFEMGYGVSQRGNANKNQNYGGLINGDFFSLWRTQETYWTLNASAGEWYSNADKNKNLTTAALALGLRYYLDFQTGYPIYLLGTMGPAYISKKAFAGTQEGSNFAAQWNAGIGTELSSFDINFRVHDYIRRPALGFNAVYLLSLGVLF